ncbi:MAG: hypothetical protein R2697_07455 [Ilumatobacteraceae bacterium]
MIRIRDVGPRDGLQNEAPVDPVERAWLAEALAAAGLRDVEVASFVSPKAVPSMAEAATVVARLPSTPGTTWWALVPNARGVELARQSGLGHLTVTISSSEGYSRKNVGRSTDEAIDGLADIAVAARRRSGRRRRLVRSGRRSPMSPTPLPRSRSSSGP